jgi:hypothetical protein
VKIVAALRVGGKQLIMRWRMWLTFYISNLIFALFIALPFRNWLSQAVGHSQALTDSIGRFDFTFLMDAFRNFNGFSLLCSQASLIAVAYLIFSAFLIGGALYIYIHHQGKFGTKVFVAEASMLFWKMLRISGYFLLMQLLVLAILVGILTKLGVNPKVIVSDVQYVQTLKILVPVYLFVAMLIAIMHTYVKIHLVRDGITVRRSFSSGIRFVFRHFASVLILYMINLVLLLGLCLVYFWLRKWIPSISGGGILPGFLLSQLFLIGRIGVKLVTLSSANVLVQITTGQGT